MNPNPRCAFALTLSAWLVCLASSPSAHDPGETPNEPRRAAEALVAAMAAQDFRGAVAHFDATMSRALPETALREAWTAIAGQAGPFKQTLGTRSTSQAGLEVVFVTCEFERAIIDAKVVLNPARQISGLWFLPGQRPAPARHRPSTVRETELKVGDDPWALPGTLSVPTVGTGPWPAVVLVHGSGPNDRDETVGLCKPFRDLAWGLAARGIVGLRYDKATQVYPDRFRAMSRLTVKEEVIDDALRAVDRLRRTEGVAAHRIFLLGHSLGGTLAPRIAQADLRLAGVIILAGATRPLEDLMVEQSRYLLALDGSLSADDQTKLAELEAQATQVKQLAAAASGLPILGAPTSYWLDLRSYDAVATARGLPQPLLILQGGRDYQVTEADFNGWKQGLTGRLGVTYQLFPELNHLFVAGEGKSHPGEYERPDTVAEGVLDALADWIARCPPAKP